jgi:2-dehydropantoate 2-reductase
MERVRTLTALFEAAKGLEIFAVVDIVRRLWEKPVHLSTATAMTCLMQANGGEIVRTPRGREMFLDQLRCGAAIAAANVTHRARPS